MTVKAPLFPSVAKSPGTSLHRQLFIVLRDEIMSGQYPGGALLPKEGDLCTRFNVSRITVRRALTDLEQLGLVEKKQGKGTFVSNSLPKKRPLATLDFLESLKRVSDTTVARTLLLEEQQPTADIASQLELPGTEPVVHMLRLRSQAQLPVLITETWVPAGIAGAITEKALKKQPLYELLIARGVRFGRVVQEINATAATPAQAALLNTGVGQPIIRLVRLMYDMDEVPVQVLHVYLNPERSRLLMEFPADSINTLRWGAIIHDE